MAYHVPFTGFPPFVPAILRRPRALLKRRKDEENITDLCDNVRDAAGLKKIEHVKLVKDLAEVKIIIVPEDLFQHLLPTEKIILMELCQEDLLVCRSVSKAWRKSVDESFKFDVTIDDRHQFIGKCDISMQMCVINSLISPKHRWLFQSVVPTSVVICRKISQWNMGELSRSWITLTKLTICWRPLINNYLFRNCQKLGQSGVGFLPNIKCLKISLITSASSGKIFITLHHNLNYLLERNYPLLKHFSMNFVFTKLKQTMLDLLTPFISRHAGTIRKLDISFSTVNRQTILSVPQNSFIYDTLKYPNTLKEFSNLKDVQLTSTRLQCPCTSNSPNILAEWKKVLQSSRSLEVVVMSKLLGLSVRRLQFYQGLISKYYEHLRVIEIMNVSIYDSLDWDRITPLDMTMFAQCKNLKTLRLWRAPIILFELQPEMPIEIYNLGSLPPSLQNLTLDGLPASSSDILFTLKKLTSLRTLNYSRAFLPIRYHNSQSGINVSVLPGIITHPTLIRIEIHTASCVPQNFFNLKWQEFTRKNNWKDVDIKVYWPGCMQLSMQRKCISK